MIRFKEWNLFEAVYKGMIGIIELIKFEAIASPTEKKMFQALLAAKKNKEALAFLEAKLNVKFK
jgi:hypothetical protein